MADVPEAEKTPVTIITGFLGAGKTTLVNHILKGDHGKLIAVIENEFGAVSIDDALVGENMKEKEDVITMDNGCVCCTVRGDLVRALLTLKDRPKKFDHVIIETTGLADPAPVAFTFFINPEIADTYRIDSILCLADAKHVGIHLEEEKPDGAVNEAVQQVAFADRILLNKIDLVSEAELAEVVDTVKSINAVAEVIKTTNSVIDLDRVRGQLVQHREDAGGGPRVPRGRGRPRGGGEGGEEAAAADGGETTGTDTRTTAGRRSATRTTATRSTATATATGPASPPRRRPRRSATTSRACPRWASWRRASSISAP